MQKSITLLLAVILALVAVVALSWRGWNSASSVVDLENSDHEGTVTSTIDSLDNHEHELGHDHNHESDSSTVSTLDKRAFAAAEVIKNAESSADIMTGVRDLRAILAIDSNHIPTIELLAELSIQSGQLEKALDRYEKLISLQPENSDYKQRRNAICKELGRADCT